MNPKLTDQAVGELPLSHGRADLLEEIMRTPVLDERPVRTQSPRRTRRWVVPLAAAATVAALATAPVWWPSGSESPAPAPLPIGAEPAPAPDRPGHLAVLEAPGWTVDTVGFGQGYGSVSYTRGDSYFEITWAPASSYADYVKDREHVVDPPAPGEPIEVLGLAGQLWPYSADDHTVIREVQNGHWMEFRGGGVAEGEYRALLDQLRMVDRDGLEQTLPPKFVTHEELDLTLAEIEAEIVSVTGRGLPEGAQPLTSDETDPYHLGVDVAGGYACAWMAAYADGDDRAQEVLATARDWTVLQRMAAEGGYSDVLWQYADEVVAGRVPEGYREGLGC